MKKNRQQSNFSGGIEELPPSLVAPDIGITYD